MAKKSVLSASVVFILYSMSGARAEVVAQPSFDCAKATQPVEKAFYLGLNPLLTQDEKNAIRNRLN
jgi:uncharacterized protein